MLRVLIHFTHLPEPAVLSHGGFKLLGRAALSDHPPRWISPYRTSPASQLQSRARRLRSSIELLHMLSNHITSFEREDLRRAAVTVPRPRSMRAIQRIGENAREVLHIFVKPLDDRRRPLMKRGSYGPRIAG